MPNDADRAGTPGGVFGAELRYYRTRGPLAENLASRANVSHDVLSKIETGERPPSEDFPPLVVPGLLQTEDYARAILSASRRQPGRPR
jgi:hypothetical protein